MYPTIRRTLTLLVLLISLSTSGLYATHIMGGNFNFICINSCTVRVELRIYRDCSGSSSITATSTAFAPTVTGCTSPTPVTAAWVAEPVIEVTPVCPGLSTNCTNGSFRGVQEYYFWREYNVCNAGPCPFNVSWSLCCRNGAITSGASNQNTYIQATFNNAISGCNSTPQFTNPPIPYICAGDTFIFNQGAYDPDGDSLSYRFGPCYQNNGAQVTYNAGYSQSAPLGPTWSASIDSVTGDISIIPQPGNIVVGVLCVYVDEWRNGSVVNTIERDIQVAVIACPPNDPPPVAGVSSVNGAFVNNPLSVTTCTGSQLCFNIRANDPNPTDFLTMYWDGSLAGGTFTSTANPNITDTITGLASTQPTARFCWTPTTPGLHTFVVTIVDDACPVPGRVQYTIRILVNTGLQRPSATAALTNNPSFCTEVQFNSSPPVGGTGPFFYDWIGPGNLNINPSNNLPSLTHIYPGPGAYPYTLTVTDAFGCQGQVSDTIVVPSGPTAAAGPDISLCSGFATTLGSPLSNAQNFQWIGPNTTPLSSTTISQPGFLYTNAGPNPDTLSYTLQATSGACTSLDYVDVVVFPIPTVTVTPTAATACDGDTVMLVATGGSTYLWSTGETNDTIYVTSPNTTTYTVTAIDNGCSSPPASATVTVLPGPVGIVSGTDFVCPGEFGTINVVGGNNWVWSTGATSNSINVGPITSDTSFWVVPSVGTCSGQPVTHTIQVHDLPTADFTSSTACEGGPTSFTNTSIGGSGTVTNYTWNFGDPNSGLNNTSTNQNPSHTFTAPGTYNVTLTVTASTGCTHTVTNTVTVNPLPVVNFTFDDVCEGTTMDFTNTSGANATTWSWNFGDNTTSNLQNPNHQFTQPGAYNITLTVTDPTTGCSNTVVKTGFVHPNPEVDFDWENSCFNTITTFDDLTTLTDPYGTTLSYWEWDLGNGTTSNLQNPVVNYPVGSYPVTLTVATSKGCTDSRTRIVGIEEIAPITAIDDTVCSGYSAFLEVTGAPSGTEVIWLYDPASNNPFHTGDFLNTVPLAERVTYWVALRDEDGCISNPQRIRGLIHWTPPVDFAASATEVSIPNAIVEFTSDINFNAGVTSILWDFGDGTNSAEANPVHQYTAPGVYTVTLTVEYESGCTKVVTKNEYITVDESINLWVPNAFTPNGDGTNDEFTIHSTLITDFEINIYNRWGTLIYTSQNMNFAWDGKDMNSGAIIPEGVVSYVIKATAYNGQVVQRSGTITIIR